MCMTACLYVSKSTMRMQCLWRTQRDMAFLTLELQVVASFPVGAGNQNPICCKSSLCS